MSDEMLSPKTKDRLGGVIEARDDARCIDDGDTLGERRQQRLRARLEGRLLAKLAFVVSLLDDQLFRFASSPEPESATCSSTGW